jgi:hypothetical protein
VARAELVVAVGQHQERGHLADAAAEELDQVERGRVRPVQILEHDDDGRAAAQLLEDRGEDRPRRRGAVEMVAQLRTGLLGDVVHGPERPRGVQGIARAPQRAGQRGAGPHAAPVVDERGLADAGLAVHQRDAPLAGRGLAERGGERLQGRLPLQQRQGARVGRHDPEPIRSGFRRLA